MLLFRLISAALTRVSKICTGFSESFCDSLLLVHANLGIAFQLGQSFDGLVY